MEEREETVVLYGGMGVGHLNPTVELAKPFRRHGYQVAVVAVQPTRGAQFFSKAVSEISAANPSLSFHILPPPVVDMSPPDPSTTDHITSILHFLHLNLPGLRSFLLQTPAVVAVVVDFFCSEALTVVRELRLPAFVFFPTSAANLSVFLSIMAGTEADNYKDLGAAPLSFPGVQPMPANHLPVEILDRESTMFKSFVNIVGYFADFDGILVNSFEYLDRRALRAFEDGDFLPGRKMPPVYAIGPLASKGNDVDGWHECLGWLDSQPEKSVVFLCFGSWGSFSQEQITEIAVGLENSGHRFLWVVKNPKSSVPGNLDYVQQEPDLEQVLPPGFAERTKDRGMVVKSWAPQTAVLNHAAIGAFVSHCGWNSVLEAITAGVPIICWPLYAEQRMNKVFLVLEAEIGIELKGYDGDLVTSEQLEKAVKWAMDDSPEMSELRERVAAAKHMAEKAATTDGGSSAAAFTAFLEQLNQLKTTAT